MYLQSWSPSVEARYWLRIMLRCSGTKVFRCLLIMVHYYSHVKEHIVKHGISMKVMVKQVPFWTEI